MNGSIKIMEYVYLSVVAIVITLLVYKQYRSLQEQHALRLEIRRLEIEIESDERLLSQCRLQAAKDRASEATDEQVEQSALAEYNRQRQALVRNRKDEIIRAITKQKQIQTGEVMDLLDIPRSTAQRYLREMEEDGEIQQVGDRGAEVYYIATHQE